jgi:hypothetical protein
MRFIFKLLKKCFLNKYVFFGHSFTPCFSPWNALSEHRPIGQLNRIRKEVYEASSKYRRNSNQKEVPEILDW